MYCIVVMCIMKNVGCSICYDAFFHCYLLLLLFYYNIFYDAGAI